ncbi:MAG: hypothetical protein ACJASV_001252 [Pseudorhodobacter sp.]|jgi:hypothetical protein
MKHQFSGIGKSKFEDLLSQLALQVVALSCTGRIKLQ